MNSRLRSSKPATLNQKTNTGINGGSIIARVLQAWGVRQLFTLCGGHIAPIYVEAERAGLRVVDLRHEATAVFAADATARLTGIPGVAAVTAGPGVTNSITALKNAQLAESPLLLLGGATATLLRGRGALQDIDQLALVRPHVKWMKRVRRRQELGPAIDHAMRTALSGVPGPVFVEVPVDLLYSEAVVREWYVRDEKPARNFGERLRRWYIRRHVEQLFNEKDDHFQLSGEPFRPVLPEAAGSDLRRVRQLLQQAERPVLLISSGAMMIPEKAGLLAEAVLSMGIPTFLSGMARGLTGPAAVIQYRHQRKKALREADLIILAGVAVDFRLNYGRHLSRQAIRITINRNRDTLRKNLPASLRYHADPCDFLIALASGKGPLPAWESWKNSLRAREETRDEEIEKQASIATEEGINPIALLRRLEKLLPDNSILIADGGDFAATAAYSLRPRHPLHWLDPGVFGTLGVGGGFAVGSALHYPDDYQWIIYGDGSAAYSLMEFDTFTKNRMKVCAIIGNNGAWQQITRDQVPLLGAATATLLPRSDYQQAAEAFGAAGERIERLEDMDRAISRAIASMDNGIPYLINAQIGNTEFRKGSISM